MVIYLTCKNKVQTRTSSWVPIGGRTSKIRIRLEFSFYKEKTILL